MVNDARLQFTADTRGLVKAIEVLDRMDKKLDTLTGSFKQNSTASTKAASSVDRVKKSSDRLNKSLARTAKRVGIFVASVLSIRSAARAFGEFERSFVNFTTLLDESSFAGKSLGQAKQTYQGFLKRYAQWLKTQQVRDKHVWGDMFKKGEYLYI